MKEGFALLVFLLGLSSVALAFKPHKVDIDIDKLY